MNVRHVARLLAYVTGLVNQELLLKNEYLVAENRILRSHLPKRLRLNDAERSTLAEVGKQLGRKLLSWWPASPNPIPFSPGIAGSLPRNSMVPNMEISGAPAGYTGGREAGGADGQREILVGVTTGSLGLLFNLGHNLSDQTVGNILRRHGIPPAMKRQTNTTWKDFISSHMAVLAGVDFFTREVLTWRGFLTYYVLFFLHLEIRRVTVAGITRHPTEEWMQREFSAGVRKLSAAAFLGQIGGYKSHVPVRRLG